MKGIIETARGWRPNSAHAIAVLALFLALGGSAVALRGKGSVGADDIRRGAVKTKKIADFAVTPFKTNLGRFGFNAGEVTTTSGPPVTLAGGPAVTVTVPKGALWPSMPRSRAGSRTAPSSRRSTSTRRPPSPTPRR